MKMICELCGHQGQPKRLWFSGLQVALECSGCGAIVALRPEEAVTLPLGMAGQAERVEGIEELSEAGAANTGQENAGAVAIGEAQDSSSTSPEGGGSKNTTQPPLEAQQRVSRLPLVAEEVAPVQCPKCGFRQESGESCARCGLVYELYKDKRAAWREKDGYEACEALWEDCLEAGTEQAHADFWARCQELDLQDFGSDCYRFRVADRPDDWLAAAQLERIAEQANAELVSMFGSQPRHSLQDAQRYKQRLMWFVVLAIFALALYLLYAFPNLLAP